MLVFFFWLQALRSSWGGLLAAIHRARNETENQILIRDSKGLSEDQLKEYRSSFNHFDRVRKIITSHILWTPIKILA